MISNEGEGAVRNAPKETQIKVENIGGPLLLIHPEYDGMWPSELSAEIIGRRLKEKGFPYPEAPSRCSG